MNRALQFLTGGGKPYKCSAGKSLITVLPNGDILPCRRMDVKVGNLMVKPLEELYYDSDFFQKLREPNQTIEGCEKCFYSKLCLGGLKCLSYALNKTPFKADPGC